MLEQQAGCWCLAVADGNLKSGAGQKIGCIRVHAMLQKRLRMALVSPPAAWRSSGGGAMSQVRKRSSSNSTDDAHPAHNRLGAHCRDAIPLVFTAHAARNGAHRLRLTVDTRIDDA